MTAQDIDTLFRLAELNAGRGNPTAARDLNEHTDAPRRRVLGEDHPNTLRSANNLASIDLRQEATVVVADPVLAHRRRHPPLVEPAQDAGFALAPEPDAPGERADRRIETPADAIASPKPVNVS